MAHGPVVAAVVGFSGQKYLAAAGLHHLTHVPFAGSPQVIALAGVSVLAIPCGSVNVIDLAIVIFNQGHDPLTEVDYAHLDVNNDGFINFDDVKLVMEAI